MQLDIKAIVGAQPYDGRHRLAVRTQLHEAFDRPDRCWPAPPWLHTDDSANIEFVDRPDRHRAGDR